MKNKKAAGRPRKAEWVSVAIVAEELGVSTRHISRLRERNILKPNTHWRKISSPGASRDTYRYELLSILKMFGTVA